MSEEQKGDKIPLSCTEDEKGTKRMDTFIDKLAQKRNAQEMIKANMTAEAEKMEQLKSQMKAYDELMQEIRKVNLKTAENVSEVRTVLKECMEKLDAMQAGDTQEAGAEETLAQIKDLLEQKFRQSDDFIHKENVRVYRNVQAAVVEELNKQTEEWKNSQPKGGNNKAILPISILILIGVIADVALQVLSLLNVKFF
ncbi:MAG: hypothetical protein K1W10_01685 [Lachnospiraceae bacterium]